MCKFLLNDKIAQAIFTLISTFYICKIKTGGYNYARIQNFRFGFKRKEADSRQ